MGDNFNRGDANNLGPGWQVTYSGGGKNTMTVNNNEAKFAENSILLTESNRTAVIQRVDPATRYTGTDYQMCPLTIGAAGGTQASSDNYSYFRIYLRANDAFTQYVAWEVKHNGARLIYNIGSGGDVQIGGWFETSKDNNTTWYGYAGGSRDGISDRQFTLYKGSSQVAQVSDTTGVTLMGSANRGWGFGLKSSGPVVLIQGPPGVEQAYITDFVPSYEPVPILPVSLNSMPVRTGATTLYVQLSRSEYYSSYGVSASSYRPRLHVMAVPA
jgi:hypothetical protein